MSRIASASCGVEQPAFPYAGFDESAGRVSMPFQGVMFDMIKRIASASLLCALIVTVCAAVPPGPGSGSSGADSRCTSNLTFVILGSSTAAGAGARPISMSWANRYATYLAHTSVNNVVINRASGGYTTYHCLPTGTPPTPNRPNPDVTRNITYALAQHPSAIILSLPTNDVALGYAVEETERNFQTIAAAARAARVPLWISTSQPRNLTDAKRANLVIVRDFIFQTFGSNALDFWTGLAAPDGTLLKACDSGDGTHPNNLGHAVLFRRLVAANLPEVVCGLTAHARARTPATRRLAQSPAAPAMAVRARSATLR
jgi:lysophospholipase L1-like esterase